MGILLRNRCGGLCPHSSCASSYEKTNQTEGERFAAPMRDLTMSLKKTLLFAALLSATVLARPALAQHGADGCTDSPENPTVILAGLASGAYGVNVLRTRLQARRRSQSK